MITAKVMAQVHAQAYAGQGRGWSEAEFAALLTGPGILTLGDARGFILSRQVLDEGEVLTLVTDPAYRRQGIARRMLALSEEKLYLQGATRQFLEVAAGNTPARALYAESGYAQIGLRRGYYALPDGSRDDAVILQKTLG
ncbi:GNAT family N-acetyltransferase [Roseovarius aestuarii]|nr:GNAT family N-acetyltransferase [Roseovarius aestuarii]